MRLVLVLFCCWTSFTARVFGHRCDLGCTTRHILQGLAGRMWLTSMGSSWRVSICGWVTSPVERPEAKVVSAIRADAVLSPYCRSWYLSSLACSRFPVLRSKSFLSDSSDTARSIQSVSLVGLAFISFHLRALSINPSMKMPISCLSTCSELIDCPVKELSAKLISLSLNTTHDSPRFCLACRSSVNAT